MKKWIILFWLFSATFGISSATALDIDQILKSSDAALDRMHSGSRKIVIIMRNGDRITKKWVARRAQKGFPDGTRNLMVIMEPEKMKGNAVLYLKTGQRELRQWVYMEFLRRTLQINYSSLYEPFFGTDFTYADFDMGYPPGKYNLIGEEKYGDKMVFKTDVLPDLDYYYSHVVSLVDKENFLPIKRDYYDAAGRLWKTKQYSDLVMINGIPTYLRIKMVDVQHNRSTEFVFSEICDDVKALTKSDFDPDKLSEAIASPVCKVGPATEE